MFCDYTVFSWVFIIDLNFMSQMVSGSGLALGGILVHILMYTMMYGSACLYSWTSTYMYHTQLSMLSRDGVSSVHVTLGDVPPLPTVLGLYVHVYLYILQRGADPCGAGAERRPTEGGAR